MPNAVIAALYIASWVVAIGAGIGISVWLNNGAWMFLCFAPFLWLVNWGKQ